MKHLPQIIFTLLMLCIGILAICLFVFFKPEAETRDSDIILPQVHQHQCRPFTEAVIVGSQGSVGAYRSSNISAEVDGNILSLSEHFLSGRRVSGGDVLISIDPEPYQLALKAAEAQIAQAKLNLAQEQALADQARADWLDLDRDLVDASELVLRKPQIALAQAAIQAAEAEARLAQRRLSKCQITAPFDGIIETASAGRGQFVRAGTSLGTLIDSHKVEVALPILNQDLAFVELPVGENTGSPVRIETQIGQQRYTWTGRITRLIPRIGARNQQMICIAEIEKPFDGSMPLLPDLFVQAGISGIVPQDTVEIPRAAVHGGSYVWLINDSNQLQRRDISISRYNKQALQIAHDGETVLVNQGLQADDRVCVTRLTVMSDKLQVHPITPKQQLTE